MPGRKQIVRMKQAAAATPAAATQAAATPAAATQAAATPAAATQVVHIARPEMEEQNILLLPPELLILIVSFLSETSQSVCRFVCRGWKATIHAATFGVIPRMFAVDIASSLALMTWQQATVLKYRPFDKNTILSIVNSNSADKLERIALLYRKSIIEHWSSLKREAIESDNLKVLRILFALNTKFDLRCSKINKADRAEVTSRGHNNILRWVHQDLPLFSVR